MKYLSIVYLLCCCLIFKTNAQNVGIGTATPDASAQLDVSSTTKGFLPPRLLWTQIQAISNPVAGLTVYDINAHGLRVYDGQTWVLLGPKQLGFADPTGATTSVAHNSTPTGYFTVLASVMGTDKSVYFSGYFSNQITINNVSVTGTSSFSGFVAALDSAGNCMFIKPLNAAASSGCTPYALALDASGNIYVGGYYTGTVDLDPGAATVSVSSISGSADVFIEKLNSSGIYQWSKVMGGTSTDYLTGIATDGTNVYACGNFQGSSNFGMALVSAGGSDGWVGRYSAADGTTSWAVRCGGSGSDDVNCISVYAGGGILIGGDFSGIASFGASNLTSAGGSDGYLAFINTLGAFSGSYKIGGTGDETVWSLYSDATGFIYAAGSTTTATSVNIGLTSAFNISTFGGTDAFVAEYNSSLAVYAGRCFGGAGTDSPQNYDIMDVDNAGNVYLAFSSTSSPLSLGGFSFTNFSGGTFSDSYRVKLSHNLAPIWVQHAGQLGLSYPSTICVSGDGKLLYSVVSTNSLVPVTFIDFTGVKQTLINPYISRYEE